VSIPSNYQPAANLLDGRVILVTGATAGIGRAIAVAAAAHGAQVIAHGRDKRKLAQLHDEIVAAGGPAPDLVQLDLKTAQGDEYQGLIEQIESNYGRLDGLLNNASMLGELTPLEHYDIGRWQEVIHVNLNSTFILTRCLLPLLKRSDDAALLFTTSTVGHLGRAYWGAYAVSKFGVEGMFQILAHEYEDDTTLRINCINPGATRTDMRRLAYPAEAAESLKTPQDLAPLYLYLLGPDSKNVRGQLITAPNKAA
jgi:NAD(P)-dependent dehydrogenase (short-subunit alcohol dehydrogenase family)